VKGLQQPTAVIVNAVSGRTFLSLFLSGRRTERFFLGNFNRREESAAHIEYRLQKCLFTNATPRISA